MYGNIEGGKNEPSYGLERVAQSLLSECIKTGYACISTDGHRNVCIDKGRAHPTTNSIALLANFDRNRDLLKRSVSNQKLA